MFEPVTEPFAMPENNPTNLKYCRNCDHPMQREALYCEHCGQKYTTGRITFKELLSEFFSEVFSLDSKIFKTIGALFVPGKLTNEYFAGRHRSYAPPIRLFFVTAVVFFALLSIVANQNESGSLASMDSNLKEKAYRSKFMDELEAARDSIKGRLPDEPIVDAAFDTLENFLIDPRRTDRYIGYLYLTDDWTIKDTAVYVDYKDLVLLPQDSFFNKYHINGVISQTMVRQNIRLQNNQADFLRYLMGQMVWIVLLMMPLLALILKLLYIRRKKYYIEHLIFSFHYHAFGFVAFSLPLLLTILPLGLNDNHRNETFLVWAYSIPAVALAIYLFMAMRRVYQQGLFKTLVKFSILNFMYLFIFIIMLLLGFLTSLLLY